MEICVAIWPLKDLIGAKSLGDFKVGRSKGISILPAVSGKSVFCHTRLEQPATPRCLYYTSSTKAARSILRTRATHASTVLLTLRVNIETDGQ
jgi:hypothetical protein